jgi:GT2 family glycosyltransferase
MNLALISREALVKIGFLSSRFVHSKADFDFGFRLKKAGGRVFLAPGFMGECSRNSKVGTSAEQNLSFAGRIRRVLGVKEHPFLETCYYYRQHAGPFWRKHLLTKYWKKVFSASIV